MPRPVNLMISDHLHFHGCSGSIGCSVLILEDGLAVHVYFGGTCHLNVAMILLVQFVRWVGYADSLLGFMIYVA
jgi:hypothetical protein